jgi:hypothetical protein
LGQGKLYRFFTFPLPISFLFVVKFRKLHHVRAIFTEAVERQGMVSAKCGSWCKNGAETVQFFAINRREQSAEIYHGHKATQRLLLQNHAKDGIQETNGTDRKDGGAHGVLALPVPATASHVRADGSASHPYL